MTLTTHIVAGAAGARLFAGNPVEGFIIGWLSHYVLDSIIHWDYKISSAEPQLFLPGANAGKVSVRSRAFISDILKVSFDVALGFVLVFMFLSHEADPRYLLLLAGGLGGVIPDFLQFIYVVWRNRVLEYMQKLHNLLHAKTKINHRPVLGIISQALLILIILFLFNFTY